MKILFATTLPHFPAFGGASKNNRRMAELMAAKGNEVRIVSSALGIPALISLHDARAAIGREADVLTERSGVLEFTLRGVRVAAVIDPAQLRQRLVEEVESFRPDWLMVGSGDASHSLMQTALRVAPDRVIYLVYTITFLPFGTYAMFPSEKLSASFDALAGVVVVSKHDRDYVSRQKKLPIEVLYPLFDETPLASVPVPDGRYVTMVNPSLIKGIDIFVGLAEHFPQVPFLAIASWATTSQDRERMARCPNIEIRGPQRDMGPVYNASKVLLLPSLWPESFGMVSVEAMRVGVPVISSDTGGLPEAKLGTKMVIHVNPIEAFGASLDDNMFPLPREIPPQDLAPWVAALNELINNRPWYEESSVVAARAADRFLRRQSVDSLEAWLQHLERRSPPQDTAPSVDSGSNDLARRIANLSRGKRAQLLQRFKPNPTELAKRVSALKASPNQAVVQAAKTAGPSSFSVQVKGKGAPMILIPGVACSGRIWDGAVERFRARHELHVLSLAGFGGGGRIPPPFFETFRRELGDYIRTNGLDHPVVIGHSLGGTLGLWLALRPSQIGAVVSIEGSTFWGDPDASGVSAASQVELLRREMHSPGWVDAFQRRNREGVARELAPGPNRELVVEMGMQSDAIAVAEAGIEMLSLDLRGSFLQFEIPILQLVGEDSKARISIIPSRVSIAIPGAGHFPMLDRPDIVFGHIERFLIQEGSLRGN